MGGIHTSDELFFRNPKLVNPAEINHKTVLVTFSGTQREFTKIW